MEAITNEKYRTNKFSDINQEDTLLIAIGNSARSDDGLGWAFLEQLQLQNNFKGKLTSCYQLQIEDAEVISHYPKVVFVDACESNLPEGYVMEETEPLNDFTFTTHALTPSAVLFLSNDLYQKKPQAFTLKIKGHDWDLKIGMSDLAKRNLEQALNFFEEIIK